MDGRVLLCDCAVGTKYRMERAARLRAASALPLRFSEWTFESYLTLSGLSDAQRKAAEKCRIYAERGQIQDADRLKNGLLLFGNIGTGKSGLAAAVCNAALLCGVETLYRTVPDLLDYIRDTFKPDSDVQYGLAFERVKHTELLVLDDLGTENPTSWVAEKLFQLVDFRYRHNLRLIVTSNLDIPALVDHFKRQDNQTGLRIVDRLLEMCALVDCSGNNLR